MEAWPAEVVTGDTVVESAPVAQGREKVAEPIFLVRKIFRVKYLFTIWSIKFHIIFSC